MRLFLDSVPFWSESSQHGNATTHPLVSASYRLQMIIKFTYQFLISSKCICSFSLININTSCNLHLYFIFCSNLVENINFTFISGIWKFFNSSSNSFVMKISLYWNCQSQELQNHGRPQRNKWLLYKYWRLRIFLPSFLKYCGKYFLSCFIFFPMIMLVGSLFLFFMKLQWLSLSVPKLYDSMWELLALFVKTKVKYSHSLPVFNIRNALPNTDCINYSEVFRVEWTN